MKLHLYSSKRNREKNQENELDNLVWMLKKRKKENIDKNRIADCIKVCVICPS